jgi:predicted Fe-Mo cluster-binding NifX family protein
MPKQIAICSTSPSPTSSVDERFGRCACFMIWDSETNEYKSFTNKDTEAAQGAGIGAAQALLKRDVGLVIAQWVGPKAFVALEQAGIKVFTGVAGMTVAEALQSYMTGNLQELLTPNN